MAAARWLRSGVFQQLAKNQLQKPFFREEMYQSLPLSNTIFGRYSSLRRGIQTQSDASVNLSKVAEETEIGCLKNKTLADSKTDNQLASKVTETSNLKVSSRHDLAMVFTCNVCETRSVKTCCRESYENGVVVVRCGGCDNLHLIADRLGWFGEPGSVEDLLATRGEAVKKGSVDSLNLTLSDLAGSQGATAN